jgi:uncharacterized membrane protein
MGEEVMSDDTPLGGDMGGQYTQQIMEDLKQPLPVFMNFVKPNDSLGTEYFKLLNTSVRTLKVTVEVL